MEVNSVVLITRQCYIVECAAGAACAGAVDGRPEPLGDDGDAWHFTGPSDPTIKELLDQGIFPEVWWRSDAEGRRWCPECVAAGKAPAGVQPDHPVEGRVRMLAIPCVLVGCDGPCDELLNGDDWGGPYHFEGPRDSTISAAITKDEWQVRGGRLYCPRCIVAGVAPITDEEDDDLDLVERYLLREVARVGAPR